MTKIPEAAIKAGALALGHLDEFPEADTWGSYEDNLIAQATDVLEAALPHIQEKLAKPVLEKAKDEYRISIKMGKQHPKYPIVAGFMTGLLEAAVMVNPNIEKITDSSSND